MLHSTGCKPCYKSLRRSCHVKFTSSPTCPAAAYLCDHLQLVIQSHTGDLPRLQTLLKKLRDAGAVAAICGLLQPEDTPPDTSLAKPSTNWRLTRGLAAVIHVRQRLDPGRVLTQFKFPVGMFSVR